MLSTNMKAVTLAVLAGATISLSAASADTFPDPREMVAANGAACSDASKYVAVSVDGANECIRYFVSGFKPDSKSAIVYIHGDVVWQDAVVSAYKSATSETRQALADTAAADTGFPVIMIARPGTYGSSGNHGARRQQRELDLVEAALKKIIAARGIRTLAVSGQSGGGSIAAFLATRLDETACSVFTSPALSIRALRSAGQENGYYYGHAGIYDPLTDIPNIKNKDKHRLFIIGDPQDTYSLAVNQLDYMGQARGAGVNIVRYEAEGNGHHALDRTGWNVAAWCLKGSTDAEIADLVARKVVRY